MPKRKITIFKFGYGGWGNATDKLKEAVNAVEDHRGHEPPLWVDTRINPYGRAKGFKGRALAGVVGSNNYDAIPKLGNVNVTSEATSDGIRIKSPRAAEDLLALAMNAWAENRRVIYFCECEDPATCHRTKIALHLIRAARRQKKPVAVQIVEWPGGEPSERRMSLKIEKQWLKGANVALPHRPRPLWKYAGLPAGTLVRLHDGKGWERTVAVKSVTFHAGRWQLPLVRRGEPKRVVADAAEVEVWRKSGAYNPVYSPRWTRS